MRRSRSGFTLVESCAAAALLAAALTIVVALLTSVARQRQSAGLHAKAVVAADNLLERLTAGPYDSITPQRADELRQASKIAEQLPDGTVALRVAAIDGSPPGKRIEVDVHWRSGSGGASRQRVATWVFRKEKQR
ncbi:MAG: hypothetical protein B7Z73_14285 [Planctomycetia bacterium 21-64-5]|nr:MAG: hypothetical protein B7Z73_14285 [Planctomycetia bacterium 21-64-5]HQU45407.1 hypothetical protein [Pirellulales bacterium]